MDQEVLGSIPSVCTTIHALRREVFSPPPVKVLFRILFVAAVATICDYVWYNFGVHHTVANGIVHGAVLLSAVGFVLGHAAGRPVRGLPIGTLSGVGGALIYYLLIQMMDRRTYGTAIPVAWLIMWLILAALEGRWLHTPNRRSWTEITVRGLLAAIVGSLAFYLVLGTLWGRPPAGGRNYLVQFLAWAFAWTPGLIALSLGRAGRAISSADLRERIDRGEKTFILDVRSRGEFDAGHVQGAVNIPFNEVLSRSGEVPGTARDEVVLYCRLGPRAYIAGAALDLSGRSRVAYLTGHWAKWKADGLPKE